MNSVLVNLYHLGLSHEIENTENIDEAMYHRYVKMVISTYGIDKKLAKEAVELWIIGYGQNVLGKNVSVLSFLRSNENDDIQENKTDLSEGESGEDQISAELVKVQSEYDRLLEELKQLKVLISRLTAERDELVHDICPGLEAEYNARIGVLELQVFQAEIEVRELKFIIEQMQAHINRQEKASYEKAQKEASEEYRRFEEEAEKRAENTRQSEEYRKDADEKERRWENEQKQRYGEDWRSKLDGNTKSEKETDSKKKSPDEKNGDRSGDSSTDIPKYKSRSDEVRSLYRKIVKKLHPDVNPDQNEEEKNMFREAVEAYEKDDLDKLREISAMIDDGYLSTSAEGYTEEDISKIKEIIEGLKSKVQSLEDEIEYIKDSYPYLYKEILDDEKAVEVRQKDLANRLKEFSEMRAELVERLSTIRAEEGTV